MRPQLVYFTVTGVSFSDASTAFDIIVPRDDATLFTGYLGVLPAVTSEANHGEHYDTAGDSRTVFLSNGDQFREEIVRYEKPAPDAAGHFDYDVTEYTGLLSKLVSDATARWTYAHGTTGRSHITWTYGYRPLPGRRFLVAHIIGPLWIRYMRRGMGAVLKAIMEQRGA